MASKFEVFSEKFGCNAKYGVCAFANLGETWMHDLWQHEGGSNWVHEGWGNSN